MIYRNGIKEYLSTGVLFGVPMGLFFGIEHFSLIVGLTGGIMSGTLFAFLIFLFCKIMEKKFDKKREEISRERKIICDGGATYEGLGGWLFFTENSLEFYPHKINYSTKQLTIPREKINSVSIKRNNIIIDAFEGKKFPIVVSHTNEWKTQIETVIK